jgi:NADPH-dependent 7-cyano-7-deazaguanine reductase QueF
MKTKTLIFFLAMNLFSFSLSAQSKEQKIEKAMKDLKREENAAKADVYIQNKKVISDSTQIQNGIKSEAVTKKKKKKSCKKD